MARRRRRYTVAEKLEILEEARAPGSTVSEVLRRHGVDGTTYYRWEKQAKEERTGASPQIVSDNGSQFTTREFKQLVRLFELEHIRIRTYHPQSNGVLERFHRTTREARTRRENINRERLEAAA